MQLRAPRKADVEPIIPPDDTWWKKDNQRNLGLFAFPKNVPHDAGFSGKL